MNDIINFKLQKIQSKINKNDYSTQISDNNISKSGDLNSEESKKRTEDEPMLKNAITRKHTTNNKLFLARMQEKLKLSKSRSEEVN